jgi:phosphomannomutase
LFFISLRLSAAYKHEDNSRDGIMINENIFRSYDVRGIYPTDIDEALAENMGKAYGTFIGRGKKILVGRDIRTSSPSLSESLIKGLLSTGIEVVDAGVIPTPLLYFAISRYKLDGGITVSASHNPPEWNGFKICREDAHVIGMGSGLETIRDIIKAGRFESLPGGKIEDRSKEIMADYTDFLSKNISDLNGLTIGLDPGNGAYSGIATGLFRSKGANVHPINDIPDGRFPSRSPEPTEASIKELTGLVLSRVMNFGVAFDGDGDRVLFVTDKGKVVGGDIVLGLLIKEFLRPGEKVAYEVSCSSVVEDMIHEKGGVPVLTLVGHSHMKESMKGQGCRFGGEISGHMYFKETYGADDALFAALKVSELVVKSGKKLSELVATLPQYINIFEEFKCDDSVKHRVIEQITTSLKQKGCSVDTFEGTKVHTGEGWYLLRVSNTTPLIKCRVEAKTREAAEGLMAIARQEFESALEKTKKQS